MFSPALPFFFILTTSHPPTKLLVHLKRQRGVVRPDDGCQDDLLHHHRLHSLLRRPGDAPGSIQPQSELPDPCLDLRRESLTLSDSQDQSKKRQTTF